MQTLAARLAHADYRPSGFDYMRIALAIAVVCVHSYEVCYGVARHDADLIGLRPLIALILPMFFALSGFLVTGSLERINSLPKFLCLRALRILPALVVEVVLSALILGAIFTTLPLQEYFTHPEFMAYFGNIIGVMHYELPGVFVHNPAPKAVNAQLWTVPYELWCYVAISVLYLLRINRPLDWIVILALLQMLVLANEAHFSTVVVNGIMLIVSFVAGVVCYRFREVIFCSRWLFTLAMILCLGFLAFPKWDLLAALPCAYITVYLGSFNPKRKWIVESGDYSYGIFLYGYTLQQAIASFSELRSYYLNLLLSLCAAFVVAYLSWHYVEKPILGLKKYISSKTK